MLPGANVAPEEDLLNQDAMFTIDLPSFNLLADDELPDLTYLGFDGSTGDIFSAAAEAPAVVPHGITF